MLYADCGYAGAPPHPVSIAVIPVKMTKKSKESICKRYCLKPSKPRTGSKLGIALNTIDKFPIHGLRHPEEKGTNGWFIWCGDYSEDDDFFSPLHVEHIDEYLPAVVEYLELPPGYRFIIDDNNYEDVWFDYSLLKV